MIWVSQALPTEDKPALKYFSAAEVMIQGEAEHSIQTRPDFHPKYNMVA